MVDWPSASGQCQCHGWRRHWTFCKTVGWWRRWCLLLWHEGRTKNLAVVVVVLVVLVSRRWDYHKMFSSISPDQNDQHISMIFCPYGWWTNSCTTWNVNNPVNHGINYQAQLGSRISSYQLVLLISSINSITVVKKWSKHNRWILDSELWEKSWRIFIFCLGDWSKYPVSNIYLDGDSVRHRKHSLLNNPDLFFWVSQGLCCHGSSMVVF